MGHTAWEGSHGELRQAPFRPHLHTLVLLQPLLLACPGAPCLPFSDRWATGYGPGCSPPWGLAQMQIAPSGREGEVGNLVTRSLWLSNSEGWSPALLCHMLVADSFLYHGLHLLIPKMETGEKAGDQGSSVSSVPLLSLLTHFIQQSPGWVSGPSQVIK